VDTLRSSTSIPANTNQWIIITELDWIKLESEANQAIINIRAISRKNEIFQRPTFSEATPPASIVMEILMKREIIPPGASARCLSHLDVSGITMCISRWRYGWVTNCIRLVGENWDTPTQQRSADRLTRVPNSIVALRDRTQRISVQASRHYCRCDTPQ